MFAINSWLSMLYNTTIKFRNSVRRPQTVLHCLFVFFGNRIVRVSVVLGNIILFHTSWICLVGFDWSAKFRSLTSGEQEKSYITSYCKERQLKFPSAMQLTDSHSPLQQYFQRCQSQAPATLFHPGTPVWGIYGCQISGRCCLQRKKKVETRTLIPVSFKV